MNCGINVSVQPFHLVTISQNDRLLLYMNIAMLIDRTNRGSQWFKRIRKADNRALGLPLYLAYAIPIMCLLSISYIVKHQGLAFVDIGSDTFFQFLPLQVAEADQLRQLHDLTWSFNLGLGAYLGSVWCPIQLLISSLFPDSWQLAIRLPVYWFHLLLAGAFFFAYLRRLAFTENLSIFGALAYTFSSYTMVNVQWDPYMIQIVQFAAYLYFLETFLRGGKSWNAVAAGLTIGLGHVFDIYTFSLLTLLYSAARPLMVSGTATKYYLTTLCRYSCWSILGFLITSPIQFPNLYYFFDNPRVSGDNSVLHTLLAQIWQLNDRAIIGSEVAGLFGKDLLGTNNSYHGFANYFEGPGFYVGMLLLLCIPQLLAPATTRREKKFCLGAMALLALYILWPAMRYAVNGFGHTAFRLSTLWVSVGLLITGLAGLRRAITTGPWRAGLVMGASGIFIALGILIYSIPQAINFSQVLRVGAFVMVYCVVLWHFDRGITAFAESRILLPIFACELLLFAAPAMIDRTPVNDNGTSQYGSYRDGTEQALAFIRNHDPDMSFYRIEKTYNSVFLCDALIQNYHGIKSYFFNGSSMTRFADAMHLPRPVASISYISAPTDRPMTLDLLGVKYVLARDRKLDGVAGFSFLGDADGVNIYRNEPSRGFAHFYDAIADETTASTLDQDQRDALLLKLVLVQSAASIQAELNQLTNAKQDPALFAATSASLHLDRDDLLTGQVQTPKAQILLVSMPFDRGWSAYLDDRVIGLFRADYGLTAALIPAGLHNLRLSYEPPGRLLGLWFSAGSALLILALWMAMPSAPIKRMLAT